MLCIRQVTKPTRLVIHCVYEYGEFTHFYAMRAYM